MAVPEPSDDLFHELHEAALRLQRTDARSITLDEYVELVRRRPTIAAGAHSRVFSMLADDGYEAEGAEHEHQVPRFFRAEVFGLERPLDDVSGATSSRPRSGHETRRRILLLWGPPGGAKSTLATLIKRGLERWSHDRGRSGLRPRRAAPCTRSRCTWCPRSAAPTRRPARTVAAYTGVHGRGRACARSAAGAWSTRSTATSRGFPIERIYLSEAKRIGIGTFAPSDPKSMSMEQLTGGINFQALETLRRRRRPAGPGLGGRVHEGQPRRARAASSSSRIRASSSTDLLYAGAGAAVQGRQVRLHRRRHGAPRPHQ